MSILVAHKVGFNYEFALKERYALYGVNPQISISDIGDMSWDKFGYQFFSKHQGIPNSSIIILETKVQSKFEESTQRLHNMSSSC